MRNQVYKTRKFDVGGDVVTFAAGLKSGVPVVVFGIKPSSTSLLTVTFERNWQSIDSAIQYVSNVSIIAANKIRDFYLNNFADVSQRINDVFSRERVAFITPTSDRLKHLR